MAIRSLAQVWRAEGAAAVRDRIWDRARAAAHRASCVRAGAGGWPAVPLLNVIGVPMSATFGGVPLQLRARLHREAARRPVALLSREVDGSLRLECQAGGRCYAAAFPCGSWDGGSSTSVRGRNSTQTSPWMREEHGGVGGRCWNGDPLVEDPAWLHAVRVSCGWLGARAIHVENAAGLSLVSLARLAHLSLILSVHDFSLFCRRPHLWDARGGFCGYSTDASRCGACLAAAADGFTIDRAAHVRAGRAVLDAAVRTIFPSRFLRDRIAALVGGDERESAPAPDDARDVGQIAAAVACGTASTTAAGGTAAAAGTTDAAVADVLAPGIELARGAAKSVRRGAHHVSGADLSAREFSAPEPSARVLSARELSAREPTSLGAGWRASGRSARAMPIPEIALLGGGQAHKGGARFPRLASALIARGAAVTLYGGYGHDQLLALRRVRGVRVRGYYRAGSLPALLAQQGAAVAVILSGVPESFSLALSEAWAAGVPVVAPALGAFIERLRDGGGALVSADPSDEEIIHAIDRLLVVRASDAIPLPPTAEEAADRHLALYRECGLMTS